jgi:glutathione synthase/RimK-type ligase-like ATP-grasp enzyme
MPKQCLLLFAKSSVENGSANAEALTAMLNAAKKGVEAVWAYFDDLVYSLDADQATVLDTRNQRPLNDYSVVYFRYWSPQEGHALAAARICKLQGIPFVDSEVLRRGSQNKITQYVNLHEAKVPFPRTLIALGAVLAEQYRTYNFDFPVIVKDKSGTRGERNFLIHSHDELLAIIQAHPDVTFTLQEFIPNDGDYRVWVVGGEVKLVIQRRAASGSHLNNTSQGGQAKIVPISDLPANVLQDCIRAAAFYGREISGVDIIRRAGSDDFYCLEVNRAPQAEGSSFEKEKADVLAEYLASF